MTHDQWKLGTWPWLHRPPAAPRCRVIVDNDFAGDPDDLFQLVHHLLSPSVDIRGVISSHLWRHDPDFAGQDTVAVGMQVLAELAEVMRCDLDGVLVPGSPLALEARSVPQGSEAAQLIIREALRDEPDLPPLFVVCGGGLPDIASAYLLEPRIAERPTVIWIGGPEHDGLWYRSPGLSNPEYNLRIDITAGQVVLNASTLPLWLVPRNVYRQCLVSEAELLLRVLPKGALGAHLHRAVERVRGYVVGHGGGHGETYALGDSPLVLLTALQSYFEPDASSSRYAIRPCPELDDAGSFTDRTGREVRVFSWVDTRLMFEDFFAKLELFARWQEGRR